MRRKKSEQVPAEVECVRVQLDQWRGQRRPGQRIPEELWNAAALAARRHGLNHVSRTLGLDYSQLKRRAGQCEVKRAVRQGSEAVFVELQPAGRPEANAGCVVELEKGNGAKLRVCVSDADSVDWCRLKEAFLGA